MNSKQSKDDYLDVLRYATAKMKNYSGEIKFTVPKILITDELIKQYEGPDFWTKNPWGVLGREEGVTYIPECNHDYIDVGFSQVKMVCKKCDKEEKL